MSPGRGPRRSYIVRRVTGVPERRHLCSGREATEVARTEQRGTSGRRGTGNPGGNCATVARRDAVIGGSRDGGQGRALDGGLAGARGGAARGSPGRAVTVARGIP